MLPRLFHKISLERALFAALGGGEKFLQKKLKKIQKNYCKTGISVVL